MKTIRNKFVLLAIVIAGLTTAYAQDPLPSWNARPGNGDDGSIMLSFLAEPRSRAGVVPQS